MAGAGRRLRVAREAAGLSLQQVSERLRMPVHVIRALEEEAFDKLGAPVYIRGQLRSYARMLGIADEALVESAHVAPVRTPKLVPRTYTPRARVFGEQLAKRAVYVVLTAVFVVPVWMAIDSQRNLASDRGTALDMPLPSGGSAQAGNEATSSSAVLKASIAPAPAAVPARSQAPALSLKAQGDSWIQVIDRDGNTLESVLLASGERRDYTPGQVGRMVVGNASEVVVEHRGQVVDTTQWRRSNVARFTVSSDGSPTQVGTGSSQVD